MVTEVFIAVDSDEVYRATLPPGEYVIGRDEHVQIRIQHPTVSRRHARLIVEEEQVLLEDLGSGNGTTIEGAALEKVQQLYEGQTARLGEVLLRVRQKASPGTLPVSSRHYRKGDVVATGGMGAIHEARQPAMGRKVAMKVMLQEDGDNSLQRFINEARITGMLEHPNIVPVHELGVDPDGHVFYTMKFVHGTTLAEVLANLKTGDRETIKERPLSFLLTVFQKVCDAIAFAHSRGVHHRDLKPENIMIGDFGEVLVMDWGLSKETGFAADAEEVAQSVVVDAGGELRTIDGSVLGTPTYMSPEQARGEVGVIDERSDIYSLGVILHETLYLQPPIKTNDAAEMVQKVAHGLLDPLPTDPLPHLPGGKVPPSLDAVRRKAMAFKPAERYQTVPDLQADIAAYQSGFATAAEGAGFATHLVLFLKRHRGVALSMAVGLLLLLGSSVWFTFHLVRERDRAEEQTRIAQAELAERRAAEEARLLAEKEALAERAKADFERTGREEAVQDAQIARATAEQTTEQLRAQALSMQQAARENAARSWRYVLEGRLNEALAGIELAVALVPDDPDFALQKADLLQSTGQFAAAAEAYRNAMSLGAESRAAENVTLSIELDRIQAGEAKLKPQVVRRLTRALHEQGRGPEVLLLDYVFEGGGGEPAESMMPPGGAPAGLFELEAALAAYTKQSGWRPERLSLRPDGTAGLDLSGMKISDLSILRGHHVSELDLSDSDVSDLQGLRGVSLRRLNLRATPAADLGPLADEPLEELVLGGEVSDLTPLRGMALRVLDASGSQVSDLSPLAGMPLEELRIDGTEVSDLEPLRGMPLRRFHADGTRVRDTRVLESLERLEVLALPAAAEILEPSNWPNLTEVWHRGIRPSEPMTAEEYREMAATARGAWERYGPMLTAQGIPGLSADRLVMRDGSGGFDLDLRGTGATDLRPLRQVPVRTLLLDTSSGPVDVAPLVGHPTLRHVSLVGADAPGAAQLARNRELESIALDPGTPGVEGFSGHPSLRRISYQYDEDLRQPGHTAEEFFSPRDGRPEADAQGERARVVFAFDDPSTGAEGWVLRDAAHATSPVVWVADPTVGGGRGGGYLACFPGSAKESGVYFASPTFVRRNQRALFGGTLEFDLRVGRRSRAVDQVEVILEAGGKRYHHLAPPPRSGEWVTYEIPLIASAPWTVGGPRGLRVLESEFRESLGRLDGVAIKADIGTTGGPARIDLDDIRFREPTQPILRR